MAAATAPKPFSSLTAEIEYIIAGARKRGLDPFAVLAVAHSEGLGDGPGDNNTSFGPFQLHIGGKLPATVAAQGPAYAQQWANSPAGIDYALGGIGQVAQGQTGTQAIQSIVSRFEQPKNVSAEVTRASSYYPSFFNQPASAIASSVSNGGSSGKPWYDKILGGVGSGAAAAASGDPFVGGYDVAKGLLGAGGVKVPNLDPVSAVTGWITTYALRVAEVIGGFFMFLVGLYLLARQIGLSANPPGPVGAAVGAVS